MPQEPSGSAISQAMSKAGVDSATVADRTGLPAEHVEQIRQGQVRARFEEADAIAVATGVNVADFYPKAEPYLGNRARHIPGFSGKEIERLSDQMQSQRQLEADERWFSTATQQDLAADVARVERLQAAQVAQRGYTDISDARIAELMTQTARGDDRERQIQQHYERVATSRGYIDVPMSFRRNP